MHSSPLVSIIIPVHNAQAFLDECLKSVTAQVYKNLEIITVNDDSSDDSEVVIRKWQETDNRIKYFSSNQHNAALTRRVGIENANGKYVCFLDSDDIIHEEYVSILYAAISEEKAEIATAKIAIFYSRDDIDQLSEGSGLKVAERDSVAYFFNHYLWDPTGDYIAQSINAKMFKRELLTDIDYSVLKSSILEDNYIVPQILKKMSDQKIILVDRILYYYRQNRDSTMANVLLKPIEYEGGEINYVQFFDITMDYVESLYSNYESIGHLVGKVKSHVYYDLAESLIGTAVRAQELPLKMRTIEQQGEMIASLKGELRGVLASKAYRVAKVVALPMRVLRRVIRFFR